MISKIDMDEVGTLIQELVRTRPPQNLPGNEKAGAEFIVHKLRQGVLGGLSRTGAV